jgi:ATP-dependent DNA helicase RecQ
MREMLEAIESAKQEIESEPERASRSSARALLARARELWVSLDSDERQTLGDPARELRALLDAEIDDQATPTPEELLKRAGLETFRPGQREAVQAALEGRDSLVVMPTGGGKSLCYQLPALTDAGLVVVVSPLIALMADQLRRLREMGVRASMLASGMEDGHNEQALSDVRSGKSQLVLMAPERFASRPLREALAQRKVSLFVVDEAHCVAEWGHDFRPDYLRLGDAITTLGRPPVMAATATATSTVAKEIAQRLKLNNWTSIRSGFDRPNLTFDVTSVEDLNATERKRSVLLKTLADPSSRPAIVYCGTRKDTETVAGMLKTKGIRAISYHAGMEPRDRESAQRSFMGGSSEVVVATNAFGMGVDKADVRSVIHWAVPGSLEAYYQEAGRGGRDGKPARALLFACSADLQRLVRFNNQRNMSVEDVQLYIGSLKHKLRNGMLELAGMEIQERLMLSVAERSGALRLDPGGTNAIKVTMIGRLDTRAAYKTIQDAKDRGWDAYKTIERFVTSSQCRRRQVLDFFDDSTSGAPLGRCCDVCEALGGVLPGGTPSVRSANTGPEVDASDLGTLQAWRSRQADGKPEHVVATDATLKEVLARRPASTQALLKINGIGTSFCERHGDSLLATLRAMRASAEVNGEAELVRAS